MSPDAGLAETSATRAPGPGRALRYRIEFSNGVSCEISEFRADHPEIARALELGRLWGERGYDVAGCA